MTTVTIPADPDTIAAKSLDDDGWVPYPLGDDVISGEPNTHANILRTVGVKTPTLAASFFSADPSIFKWTSRTTNPSCCSKATSRSPSTPESASTCTRMTPSRFLPGAQRPARSTSQAASSPSSRAPDQNPPAGVRKTSTDGLGPGRGDHPMKRQTTRVVCRNVRQTAAKSGKSATPEGSA
jgi:hypothetical protein